MLDPSIFRLARKCLHFKPGVDLFASAEHHQLPTYYSATEDPNALGVDAFQATWHALPALYINHPWPLIHKCLTRLVQDRVQALMVVPEWPTAQWWPLWSSIVVRQQTYTDAIYLKPDGTLWQAPYWHTIIAVVDGSLHSHSE